MRGDSQLSDCSTSVSGMSLVPTSGGSHKRSIRLDNQSVCGHIPRVQRSRHMGAATSAPVASDGDCKLPQTDFRFSAAQVGRVEQLLVEDITDTASDALTDDEVLDDSGSDAKIDADAERLLQRLLCTLGVDDPRFRCKFLVCLGRRARCAEYLVRIDALSSPALYDSDYSPACIEESVNGEALPQGYARVRLRGVAAAAEWAEFLCPAGCLRRDKVQERFVELLAAAVAVATGSSPSPKSHDVDESRLCGVAGKVIDADILPELLATPPDSQLFVGSTSAAPLRQESIAIVEGCPWIRLHVGGVQLKLALAVTTERWPRGSALPLRVSLAHPDCLLIQHACAGGCAAVAAGPPPSSPSGPGARATTWQIWVPSAAVVLKRHYSPRAAPRRVERALLAVRAVTRLRTVSRHALRTLLWWHVEESAMAEWTPRSATRHTLLVLDALVGALRQRRLPCYFFPAVNVLAVSPRSTWRPAEQLDDADYAWDADAVEGYLRRLLNASAVGMDAPAIALWPGETPPTSWQLVEEALASKWSVAVRAVTPGAATRSRRLAIRAVRRHSSAGPASAAGQAIGAEAFLAPRQLDYVVAVMRGLLHARSLLMEGPATHPWLGAPYDSSETPEVDDDIYMVSASPAGDVACVVSAALQQARAQAAVEMPGQRSTSASRNRRGSAGSGDRALRQFDVAARQLMDAVRRDRSSSAGVPDDRELVRGALRWLQCAQDRAPRALAAPLRHWLKALSATLSTACWLLPQWTSARRRNRDEVAALGAALRVIGAGTATPSAAIADAESKGWRWATDLGRLPPGTQAVAAPSAGRVIRFRVGVPLVTTTTDRRARRKTFVSPGSATMPASIARQFTALLNNGARPETDLESDILPPHCRLRESSPAAALLAARRRGGLLRGIGDMAPALLRMQKFNLVHEAIASAPLSDAQRAEVVDALHLAVRESRRLSAVARRRSKDSTLLQEVYRPKSALIIETPIAKVSINSPNLQGADARLDAELRRLSIADSLMSTIRAWRSAAVFADSRFPPELYSLTAADDEKDADDVVEDDPPVSRTELTFLELTDDKRIRLGRARDTLTKL